MIQTQRSIPMAEQGQTAAKPPSCFHDRKTSQTTSSNPKNLPEQMDIDAVRNNTNPQDEKSPEIAIDPDIRQFAFMPNMEEIFQFDFCQLDQIFPDELRTGIKKNEAK